MKKYRYHVSYYRQPGVLGSTVIERLRPITKVEDIDVIEATVVQRTNNHIRPIIVAWNLMEEFDAD